MERAEEEEEEGFEPLVPRSGTPVFETGPIRVIKRGQEPIPVFGS